MYKALARLTLVAALAASPLTLHADPMMTGEFSIQGTVQDFGTNLTFTANTLETGMDTQTGTFASLLTNYEPVSLNSLTIDYAPFTPGSAIFTAGPLV